MRTANRATGATWGLSWMNIVNQKGLNKIDVNQENIAGLTSQWWPIP
jgi:hypothetical protein